MDGSRMVIGLPQGALSSYPGPAIVVEPSGRVVMANGRADLLCQAIAGRRLLNLDALLTGIPGRSILESLNTDSGSVCILELSSLPTESGMVLILGRDVTLERNLRSALVESRQRYKDLVEVSSDFAWEVGSDGRFVFVSPKGALGFSADDLVGRNPRDFMLHPDMPDGDNPFRSAIAVDDREIWLKRAEGGEACLLASSTPLFSDDHQWRGSRGVCRDVTQERMRDAALARADNRERLLSYVVRTIRDEVEPADMLRAAAEATARALGATGCQIYRILPDAADFTLAAQYGDAGDGKFILDRLEANDHFEEEMESWRCLATVSRYRHSINGVIILWRDTGRTVWGDDDRLLIDDVALQVGLANEQIANHERILRLSRTDSLTGLFNRRAFFEEIARRFGRLRREQRPASLIYVDLDNFKAVNDVHGHQMGDQALLALRDLLLHHTRPVDIVARLGGDEFAIWLEGGEERIAIQRCQDLLTAGEQLRRFSGSEDKPLQMSLGVAVHDGQSSEGLEELIGRADSAMYDVKRNGKGAWRLADAVQQA